MIEQNPFNGNRGANVYFMDTYKYMDKYIYFNSKAIFFAQFNS